MVKIDIINIFSRLTKFSSKDSAFEGGKVKRKDLDRYVKEIEEAIDKLFPEKVQEIKVTELPRVDIIEVEEPKTKKPKAEEKKERTREETAKKELRKGEAKDIGLSSRGELKELERVSAPKDREQVQTKEEAKKPPRRIVKFFDIGGAFSREVSEIPRKEKGDITPEEHPAREEKSVEPPSGTRLRIKPLVDLSMKNALKRYMTFDHEEESEDRGKEEKFIEGDISGSTAEAESFADYVFLDETEPLSSEGVSLSIGEEKLDYGDVELPRESLRFQPMVEFEPIKEEIEINVPISDERFEEIAFYPVSRPYAYVKILKDKKTVEKIYAVLEPELTESEQRYLDFIKETLDNIPKVDLFSMEERGASKYIEELVNRIISDYDLRLSDETKEKILYLIKRDTVGYGKIDVLMRDPYIEDISCDGVKIPIFIYHRDYGSMRTNVGFDSEEELSNFVVKLAQKCGKHISIAEPMLDATLPDGSRIQATLGTEVTTRGSTFTIRKFRADPFTPPDLIELGTMSPEMVAYFWLVVEHGISAIFAGGTASGKTTTLNAVALFIPREAKIVSIEETREINLPHPNWIPGVTRSGFGEVVADKVVGEIDMYDLLKAALRQRPEYIIVGEIRGREAYVLFQAMATGHTTYSTMHADSPQSLIHRLEGKPINIPRIMLQALDFVCFHTTARVKDKRVRRVTQIIEIVDIDPVTKEIITNKVFTWDPLTDTFKYS